MPRSPTPGWRRGVSERLVCETELGEGAIGIDVVVLSSILCANCLEPFIPTRRTTAFCGLACSASAKAVRYARQKYAEYGDAPIPNDVREAMQVKFVFANSGGYDASARHLSEGIRSQVEERDNGRCVLCGDLGEEIDHIAGSANDLANLQLLCRRCHGEKTRANFVPITDPDKMEYSNSLQVRSLAPGPLHAGDHVNWKDLRQEWIDIQSSASSSDGDWSVAWWPWLCGKPEHWVLKLPG